MAIAFISKKIVMLVVHLSVVLALCLFLAASAAAGEKWQGKEVTKEGALHVMNPYNAMESPKTITPKELWRLGGETDDEDELFGLISRIITDDDGNVYLLDTQLSEVKVFSPDGSFLRTIGREGEGPGEFRLPTGMFFTPEGDLGVVQVAPGKIVLLTREGEPAGEYPLPKAEDGGFLILRNGISRNKNLVLSVSKNAFSEGRFDQTQYLCSLNADGTERARYHEEVLTIDFANPVMDDSKWNNFNNRWNVGFDGRVFAAPDYGTYTIDVWSPDGKLDRVIERDYKPQKRTQDEIDLVNKILQIFIRQVPNGQVKVHDFNSDVEQIHTREDGSIWVVSSEGSRNKPDGALATFDVFDSAGRFIRQVTVMGEGDPRTDGYYFVGDRLYVVTDLLQASLTLQSGGQSFQIGDEEPEPMSVICYELGKDVSLK
jgi:hypothetical protein